LFIFDVFFLKFDVPNPRQGITTDEFVAELTPDVSGIFSEWNTHPHHHFLSLRESLYSGLSLLAAAFYEARQSWPGSPRGRRPFSSSVMNGKQ
jgi:hypothetical protein